MGPTDTLFAATATTEPSPPVTDGTIAPPGPPADEEAGGEEEGGVAVVVRGFDETGVVEQPFARLVPSQADALDAQVQRRLPFGIVLVRIDPFADAQLDAPRAPVHRGAVQTVVPIVIRLLDHTLPVVEVEQ